MIKWFYLTIDRTLTSTTIPSQSGPGRNGYEVALFLTQSSRTEASPFCVLSGHSWEKVFFSFSRDAVVLFYSLT